MTPRQLKNTLTTKRLSLGKKDLLKHYEAAIWTGIQSIFLLGYLLYKILTEDDRLNSSMLILLLFPFMSITICLNQYLILRCRQVDTNLDKETSYKIAKLTLETLQWPIIKLGDTKYLQATNPFNDIRTWGDEMITIIISNNTVLVNSMCNLNYGRMAQAAFSFGKNKQNVKKFIDTFTLLCQYPERVLQST
jgi:hypothetical protein